jgi:hypothetical protein
MKEITLQNMADNFLEEADDALYNSKYKFALESYAVARAFYDKLEDVDGLADCNENIHELLIYLSKNPKDLDYWFKYGIHSVNHFLEVDKARRKLFGLECKYEDPVLIDLGKGMNK